MSDQAVEEEENPPQPEDVAVPEIDLPDPDAGTEKGSDESPGLLSKLFGGGKKGGKKGKKKGKKSDKEGDPLDNPEFLALLATEVADLPPPDVEKEASPDTPEEVAEEGAEEAEIDTPQPGDTGDVDLPPVDGGEASDLGDDGPDIDDLGLPPGDSGPDELEQDWRRRQRQQTAVSFAIAAVVFGVIGSGIWWIMQPAPPPPPAESPGLVVLNEQGEPVEVPPTEHRASGDEVELNMPPPPETPEVPELKLAEGEGTVVGDERSTNRRPWLKENAEEPTALPDTPDTDAVAPKDEPAQQELAPPPEDSFEPAKTPDPPPPLPAKATPKKGKKATLKGFPVFKEPALPAPRQPGQKVPSYTNIPENKGTPKGLGTAPLPELLQSTSIGRLPMVSGDGRMPWKVYARPFEDNKKPKVSVIIGGMGLHPEATNIAIRRLPPEITLSFSPYAPKLDSLMRKARSYGHEVMLDLPMETENFPSVDPGPFGLLTILPSAENLSRLEMVMAQAGGYIGFLGQPGKFASSDTTMGTILEYIQKHGLLYIQSDMPAPPQDNSEKKADLNAVIKRISAPKAGATPVVESTMTIDHNRWRSSVDARLDYTRLVAQGQGAALVVVFPSPLTFERVVAWSQGLANRGVTLAPASAVVGAPTR